MELAREGEPVDDELKLASRTCEAFVDNVETQMLLSGENDRLNAIVNIHPGAGGTEAQDWAEMLMRMYLRWAERNGFKTRMLDYQDGEEAGIKSTTFNVIGDYAYGYAGFRDRRPSTRANFAVRCRQAPSHIVRFGCRLSGNRRQDRSHDRREGPADRYVSLLRKGRPARQHDGFRGADHAPSDEYRRRSARTNVRSTRTRKSA